MHTFIWLLQYSSSSHFDMVLGNGNCRLHTGIPVYANRHGILARLVASFLLWCTTSASVRCSKFGGIWETLWIFKVTRWTHDRCMKINKSPTVSSSIRASSFAIWTANLAQGLTQGARTNTQSFIFGDSDWKCCWVSYTVGTLTKPGIQMRTFLIWECLKKIMLVFFNEQNSDMLAIQEQCICKLGKCKVSWNFYLVFIIDI